MNVIESVRGDFFISTDKKKLDIPLIHSFLTAEAGWCDGIPYDTVKNSIENSLNFGLYKKENQIGFARIISDYATIAYLGDVFIFKDYRGLGLSKWLMDEIIGHPNLQGLRRWILLTSTAEWLYQKYGFVRLPNPDIYMERHNPDVYKASEKR
ncbi:Histone acetyltransferase HPA2 [Fulvivirga imtechensis AK7]|uniref:Histone acetyltransferase HPA2 n=1 Tax=Fulvivirga imtechensis AK7 TaxID=1237149 RepID=L8JUY8_9BACT|nr:GNAT family N-acetyltransferase [Fulvivirga imtechensis]ELR72610.1 Histone acetyltransferase HPA2 [Fulvivirga imtechensis AK7]